MPFATQQCVIVQLFTLDVVVLLDGNELRRMNLCEIMILFENGIEGRQSPCIQHPHTTTQLSLNYQTSNNTNTMCKLMVPKFSKSIYKGPHRSLWMVKVNNFHFMLG
jgi:hypothetical protein